MGRRMVGRAEWRCIFISLFILKITIAQEPSLTLMPETIRKNLGANVYVSCSANVPNQELVTNMEWRGPNNKVIPTDDGSITTLNGTGPNQLELFIKKLRMEDAGRYECSAIYAGNNKLSETIEVEYYRDIDFQDTEPVQTPVLNSDAKIRCKVTADPAPIVDWLKDGVPMTDTKDKRIIIQSDGILIKGIQERDEGVYRCRARVPTLGELKFMNIQVEVHVPPVITGKPKDTSGVEKESVSFLCVASGKPAPTYTWVNKDSELLKNKEGYFVDERTGELKILDLRPEHAGNYRCTAKNAAGEVFAEANLRVLMKPKVERYLNITVAENEEAELRCELSGDPLPEAIFQKETNPEPFKSGVNENGRIEVEQIEEEGRRIGIMRIGSLSRKDDGLYTCTGNSTGGKTVAWGHITVEFKPTFEDQPQDEFWSWEQQPVNLTCLATSIPNATVQWYLREEPVREEDPNIQVLSRGPNGVLRIHPVDGSYFDTYTCQATNRLGVTDHDVDLRQVQKPGPVSSTQVDKKTATTISWNIRDPLSDGGLPVLGYSVQYRLADTSWEKSENLFWSKGSSYVVDKLVPKETYVFRFAARNDVGDGEWSGEKSIDMPKRSYPEEPLIYTVNPNKVKTIPYTDHYDLQWKVPLDNGEPIESFEIVYYQVKNSSKVWEVVGSKKEIKVPYPGDSKYKLEDLNSNTYYKIELRAANKIGFSTPAEAVIKTAYDPASPSGNKPGPSVKFSSVASPTPSNAPVASVPDEKPDSNPGLIVGIIIIAILILIIVIDVILFFAKNVGLTAFFVSKLTAKPSEKDKEAMIEDGTKSSTKPDDNSNREMDKVKDPSKEKECNETTPMITGRSVNGMKGKGRQESKSLFNVFAYDDHPEDYVNRSFDSNVTFFQLPKTNMLSKSQPALEYMELPFEVPLKDDKPPLPPRKKNATSFRPEFLKDVYYYGDERNPIGDSYKDAVLIAPYHARNRNHKHFNSFNREFDGKYFPVSEIEKCKIETAFQIAPYSINNISPELRNQISPTLSPMNYMHAFKSNNFQYNSHTPSETSSAVVSDTPIPCTPRTPAEYRKLGNIAKTPVENKFHSSLRPPLPASQEPTKIAYFVAPYSRNSHNGEFMDLSDDTESSWDSLDSDKELPLSTFEAQGARFVNLNSNNSRIHSVNDLTKKITSSGNNNFSACTNLAARSLDNILHAASHHNRRYKQPTRI